MLEVTLALIPLLLLLASLLFGHYPGVEAIVRLSERMRSQSRLRGTKRLGRPTPPHSHVAGGGLLIAFGLAQRPPPLAA